MGIEKVVSIMAMAKELLFLFSCRGLIIVERDKMEEFKRQIKMYYDVYGYDVIIELLKGKYHHVSACPKSIPHAGSPYYHVSLLKSRNDVKINKVIVHSKVDSVTLFTSRGVLRFWD